MTARLKRIDRTSVVTARICDFCEHDRTLTVVHESKRYAHSPTICASCVWRAAGKLVEHAAGNYEKLADIEAPAPILRIVEGA